MAFRVFGNNNKDPKQSVKVFDVFPMTLSVFDKLETGNIHPGKVDENKWVLLGIFRKFTNFLGYYGGFKQVV